MEIDFRKIEKVSKALGDINRLKILQLIAKQGGTGPCSSVIECVNLTQPSVSHHVKILVDAGLLEAQKEGRNYTYILNKDTFNEYWQMINSQLQLELK